jgi:hypothetical protein
MPAHLHIVMTSPLAKAATIMLVGIGLYWILEQFSGTWVWLVATFATIFFIGGTCLLLGTLIPSTRQWRSVAINALVAIATTGLIFTSLELLLPLFDLTKLQESIETSHSDNTHSAAYGTGVGRARHRPRGAQNNRSTRQTPDNASGMGKTPR